MDTAEELIVKLNEMVDGGVPNYLEFQVRALLLIAHKLESIAESLDNIDRQSELMLHRGG